jgi:cell division septation protein DedD
MVFVGQLELLDKLKSPTMRQLDQRVSVYTRLDSLSPDDVVGYVQHRLQIAGASPNLPMFAPMALALLHEASGGIPRIINRLCDRALHIAWERRSPLIDRALMQDALGHSSAGSAPTLTLVEPLALASGGVSIENSHEVETTTAIDEAADTDARITTPPLGENAPVAAYNFASSLTDADTHGSTVVSVAESFDSFESEHATTNERGLSSSIETPRRRLLDTTDSPQGLRRWARPAAIAAVALLALNAVVAGASFVPTQLNQRVEARDLPPLPPTPAMLRPVVLPDEQTNPAKPVAAKPAAPRSTAPSTVVSNSTAPSGLTPNAAAGNPATASTPANASGRSTGVANPAVTKPGASQGGDFVVAVGAYNSATRADSLVQTLTANGFRAFTRPLSLKDRVLQQVWLGPYPTLQAAQQELNRLRASGGYGDAHIVLPRGSSGQAP